MLYSISFKHHISLRHTTFSMCISVIEADKIEYLVALYVSDYNLWKLCQYISSNYSGTV